MENRWQLGGWGWGRKLSQAGYLVDHQDTALLDGGGGDACLRLGKEPAGNEEEEGGHENEEAENWTQVTRSIACNLEYS